MKALKTLIRAGKHDIVVNETVEMGGNNEGANPLQYLLTALTGCTNAVASMAAKKMKFDLQSLSIRAAREFDPRGFMGDSSVRNYFETVELEVKVTTSESEARVTELKDTIAARCVLKGANVEMIDSWTIAEIEIHKAA